MTPYKAVVALAAAAALAAASLPPSTYQKPKTVIHLVTIKWAATAAPEQRRAALESLEKAAAGAGGVRNLWLRAVRVQPRDFMSAFAIEFEDAAAADRFLRHASYEAWSRTCLPLIEESRTQQVTN